MNKLAKFAIGSVALFALGRNLMHRYNWGKYYYASVPLNDKDINEEDILY